MTSNEMKIRVDVEADRVASAGATGYEDLEYSNILTKSQWYYIKQIISHKNNKKKEGFEETELRMQGLGELIKDATVSTLSSSQTGVLTNGKFFDLPTDFMASIMEECITDQDDCILNNNSKVTVPVKPVTHNEYKKLIKNTYRKPYFKNNEGLVWRMVFSREISGYNNQTLSSQTTKRHELITDGTFDAVSYRLRYLKIPNDIIVDVDDPTNQRHCELDESAQESIIEIAVRLIKEAAERQDIKNIEPINNLE